MNPDWFRAYRWQTLAVAISAGLTLLLWVLVANPLVEMQGFHDLDRAVPGHAPPRVVASAGLTFSAANLCPSAARSAAVLANSVRSASVDQQVRVQAFSVSDPQIDSVQLRESSVAISAVGPESAVMKFLSQLVRGAPALFFNKVSFVAGRAGVTLVAEGRMACEGP